MVATSTAPAMTEEERLRELQAKYGVSPEVEPNKDRLSELAAKHGVILDAEDGVGEQEYAEPTLSQKAKHVAKGFGQAGVDFVDMGYNLEHLADAGLKKAGFDGIPTEGPFAISTTKPSDLPGFRQFKENLANEEIHGLHPWHYHHQRQKR